MHNEGDAEGQPYDVQRVELVSLLKYDRPIVYVLDVLPRMDRIATEDIPRRELDEFERQALPQLQSQQDVVFTAEHETAL